MGGSSTTVQQQAAAASDVNVDITNVIETDAIAAVLEKFSAVSETTNAVLANLFANDEKDLKTRQAEILLMLNGQAIEEQKISTTKKVANMALAGTAIYLIYKGIKK